jgi:hypothetical protein
MKGGKKKREEEEKNEEFFVLAKIKWQCINNNVQAGRV